MPIGLAYPDWSREGRDWPHAGHSRFISADGHRWHVQRFGTGPLVLLLHGTAASAHSFADLAEALAPHFEVLAVDLPGHGFTRSPGFTFASRQAVARGLAALLAAEEASPAIVAGHSAGAVAGIELCHLLDPRPSVFVSFNGAFRPFEGMTSIIAPTLAKMLYLNPFPAVIAARAAGDPERVRMLAENTGSHLPDKNIRLYSRLLRYSGHVSGALSLMAGWNLSGIEERFGALPIPSLLVTGTNDKAVPPKDSRRLSNENEHAALAELPGGHILHEERPGDVAELIADAARKAEILHSEPAIQENTS